MSSPVLVHLKIKRLDISDCLPLNVEMRLDPSTDLTAFKTKIYKLLNIPTNETKIIKIRNIDNCLVPLNSLLDEHLKERKFLIEIANVSYATKHNASLLQDAYLDAVRQKLTCMESRISKAEILVPQLQTRRLNHMEETISVLSSKVSFLNRRIDELMPIQWKSKMPASVS